MEADITIKIKHLFDVSGSKNAFLQSVLQITAIVLVSVINYYHIMGYIYYGARGVMVIVVGNGHGNTSSNPGRDWLHFT